MDSQVKEYLKLSHGELRHQPTVEKLCQGRLRSRPPSQIKEEP